MRTNNHRLVRTYFNWYTIAWSEQTSLEWRLRRIKLKGVLLWSLSTYFQRKIWFLKVAASRIKSDVQTSVWSCYMVGLSCRDIMLFLTHKLFYQSSFKLEQSYQQRPVCYSHLSCQNFLTGNIKNPFRHKDIYLSIYGLFIKLFIYL